MIRQQSCRAGFSLCACVDLAHTGQADCITPIFRVELIFANFDFARHFSPAKIISTPNGISRNFPPREN